MVAEGGGASADKAKERGQLGRASGCAISVARGAGQLTVGEKGREHGSAEVGEGGSELRAGGPAATIEHDDLVFAMIEIAARAYLPQFVSQYFLRSYEMLLITGRQLPRSATPKYWVYLTSVVDDVSELYIG